MDRKSKLTKINFGPKSQNEIGHVSPDSSEPLRGGVLCGMFEFSWNLLGFYFLLTLGVARLCLDKKGSTEISLSLAACGAFS